MRTTTAATTTSITGDVRLRHGLICATADCILAETIAGPKRHPSLSKLPSQCLWPAARFFNGPNRHRQPVRKNDPKSSSSLSLGVLIIIPLSLPSTSSSQLVARCVYPAVAKRSLDAFLAFAMTSARFTLRNLLSHTTGSPLMMEKVTLAGLVTRRPDRGS